MAKGKNPNIRSAVLEVEIFYDQTMTTPERLATAFDVLLGYGTVHCGAEINPHGPLHIGKFGVPNYDLTDVAEELNIPGNTERHELPEKTVRVVAQFGFEQHQFIVLNDAGQAWCHVYIDFWEDRLGVMAMNLLVSHDHPVFNKTIEANVREKAALPIVVEGEDGGGMVAPWSPADPPPTPETLEIWRKFEHPELYNPLGLDSSEAADQAEQIRKFSPPEE